MVSLREENENIYVMYLCLSSQFFFWVGGSVKVSIEEDGVAGVMG